MMCDLDIVIAISGWLDPPHPPILWHFYLRPTPGNIHSKLQPQHLQGLCIWSPQVICCWWKAASPGYGFMPWPCATCIGPHHRVYAAGHNLHPARLWPLPHQGAAREPLLQHSPRHSCRTLRCRQSLILSDESTSCFRRGSFAEDAKLKFSLSNGKCAEDAEDDLPSGPFALLSSFANSLYTPHYNILILTLG